MCLITGIETWPFYSESDLEDPDIIGKEEIGDRKRSEESGVEIDLKNSAERTKSVSCVQYRTPVQQNQIVGAQNEVQDIPRRWERRDKRS